MLRFDPSNRSFDIWTIDVGTGNPSRLTFDTLFETSPVWSPKGESIAYADQIGNVKNKESSGRLQAENVSRLLDAAWGGLSSWSPDGKYIAYSALTGAGMDIRLIPLSGNRTPVPLSGDRFEGMDPQISPDSKWMAYTSTESGRPEIYVVAFPRPEGKWQITNGGGTRARWRRDGKELFFLSPSAELNAVDVNTAGTTFLKSIPRPLFKVPGPRSPAPFFYNYDVAQNGQRFLFNRVLDSSPPPTITVMANWRALVH
jgi:Tol biopolymer transport system component